MVVVYAAVGVVEEVVVEVMARVVLRSGWGVQWWWWWWEGSGGSLAVD